MAKELYIDISSEEAGGSLYRITRPDGTVYFQYQHSTYDSDADELKVFESRYADFPAFWAFIKAGEPWYFLHPLYIHPEQRDYISRELAGVDWSVSGDLKWQQSHQRQWTKVLSDPSQYYRGPV